MDEERIINRAAQYLGLPRIESIDDGDIGTRAHEALQDIYEREATIYEWCFLRKYEELEQLSITPLDDQLFKNFFALPVDCLLPRRLVGIGNGSWEVVYVNESGFQGTVISTDKEEITLEYTKKADYISILPGFFSWVLVYAIANFMASTEGVPAKEVPAQQRYEQMLLEAKRADNRLDRHNYDGSYELVDE
jgi:hypothetical protein